METIRKYQNLAEAGFAQSLLEAAGIRSSIAHEFAAASGPEFALWGVPLQVPAEDRERALEILNQMGEPYVEQGAEPLDPSAPQEQEAPVEKMPAALNIVALLFLLEGWFGIADTVAETYRGHAHINGLLFGVAIYFGLRCFSRGWRTFALFLIWMDMLLFGAATISSILDFWMGWPVSPRAYGHLFAMESPPPMPSAIAFLAPVMFLVSVWRYRVLTRPEIRAMFDLAEAKAQVGAV